MKYFGGAEREVLSFFVEGTEVIYNNQIFTVEFAGKPTCGNGEPKTDIYIRLSNDERIEEIKISYKLENADFLENKINSQRASQILGDNWREIIADSTRTIEQQFRSKPLIYKNKHGRIDAGSITLGWKFELLNKPSGVLSGRMDLDDYQVYDVYAGTNLSEEKKHAMVNGNIIAYSGVANYILMDDNVSSAQDALDKMISIENYIEEYPNIYFACKALNYRTFRNKYDGNRPLSVQIDWYVEDGKLYGQFEFGRPLEFNGNEAADNLLSCLEILGVETTDDLDENNCDVDLIYE